MTDLLYSRQPRTWVFSGMVASARFGKPCSCTLAPRLSGKLLQRSLSTPNSDCPLDGVESERCAFAYVQSALSRRHVSAPGGEQFTAAPTEQGDAIFRVLPLDQRPTWFEDPVLVRAQEYFERSGSLEVPQAKREQDAEQKQLIIDIRHVRAAKMRDVRNRKGFVGASSALRCGRSEMGAGVPRCLALVEDAQRQPYIPGSLVEGSRHEWPRLPYHCKPCGCYLCGEDFDIKPELVAHWRDAHIDAAADVKDALTNEQVEEEVRKRIFHDEQMAGPFEIRGQEHRRVVGAFATHQTHCAPGSGCMNDPQP